MSDCGAVGIVPTVADALPVKLARLREGVYGSGKAVERSRVRGLPRLVHLVAQESDLSGAGGVVTCCGAPFAPGTLEVVQWGDLWPHAGCVRRSPVDRAVLEEAFHAAASELRVDDSEMEQGFQLAERVVGSRPDWVIEKYSEDWTYATSFNGVLAGNRRYPRLVDVGLEWLTAGLVRPHVFRVHSCGVRDGCPEHIIRAETFSLDEMRVIEERLSVYEIWASTIDLQALAWCLIFGECSKERLKFAVI